MNLKNAVLSLLAFTGNVASADEVRAVRPGIRGDRPVGSVLPDADSKETLPEGNAEEKSDLEERRIVPTSNVDLLESKDGSRDEDGASEIDLAGPEDFDLCRGMLDKCKKGPWIGITNNQNQQGCISVHRICAREIASRKFNTPIRGLCQDSFGRYYPNLGFLNFSPDRCKATCNNIPNVKLQGVGVGESIPSHLANCFCLFDHNGYPGCQKLDPSLGHAECNDVDRHGYTLVGTGPVKHGTGNTNPNWTCYVDRSSSDASSSSTLDDSPRDDVGLAHRVE